MSRLPVISEQSGGGDRVYLDTLGNLRALKFSTYLPGGDLSASFEMDVPSRLDHRAFTPGRQITIPVGGPNGWQGIMNSPQRGTPWQFTVTGRAADGKRFNAYAPTSGNALNLNEVIDGAISRGIGWTRPSSLPTGTGSNPSGSLTVDNALAAVDAEQHKYWTLARNTLAVTMSSLPTTVTRLLIATDTAGGRSIGDYVSDVYVTYLDSTTYKTTTLVRSAASRPWGRFEAPPVDLTSRGPITAANAQSYGDSYLAAYGARLKFAGGFTVTHGQLLTTGGSPVDLACEQAGALIQVMLIDPDSSAGELSFGPVQIVIGQTDYDVDTDVLTLTPLDVQTQLQADPSLVA